MARRIPRKSVNGEPDSESAGYLIGMPNRTELFWNGPALLRLRAARRTAWLLVAFTISSALLPASIHPADKPTAGAAVVRVTPDRVVSGRLDVGSFTLFVDGARTGREQFSLASTTQSDGTALELRAESASGESRSAIRLETDSAGTPVRYAIERRNASQVTLRLNGQRVRGRFATLSRSTVGESAREYLLLPGAIVLEDEGVHQYALLVRGRNLAVGDSVRVPTLMPVDNRQGAMWLVLQSRTDTVTIAGARQDAFRWQARDADADVAREPRTIWADADGRVLRLVIASRHLDARRDDAPPPS